jgi:hypothetical protein
MSVFEATLGAVTEGLILAAGAEVERVLLNRAIDRRLQLLANAGRLHQSGLEGLSKDFLDQIEKIDPNRPMISIIGPDRPPVILNGSPDETVLAGASGFLALVRPRVTPAIVVIDSPPREEEPTATQRPKKAKSK